MSAPLPISQAYQPGRSVVAILKDPSTGFYWNTSSLGFETYAIGNAALYRIAMTDPNGIGDYTAPFPTPLVGTTVNVLTYDTADFTNPLGQTQLTGEDTTGALPTPTSPTAVNIVNKALMFLGVSTITSLSEDSEAANKAAQIYENTRTSLLRSHWWKFATFVDNGALLAQVTTDPVTGIVTVPTPGWEYLYAYPAKCLMLRRVFDNTFQDPSLFAVGFVNYTYDYDFAQFYDLYRDVLYRFKIVIYNVTFAKAIAAHVTNAFLEYTYDVTDPGMWDQYFYDAMVMSLAMQLAHPLTGKTELYTAASQSLAAILSEAKRLDAQEDRQPHNRMSSYQRARM
jgi:hypothetical protein